MPLDPGALVARTVPGALVARTVPGVVAAAAPAERLRVLIASLAPGGAERIVLDWLAAEASRGRLVELAVCHRRRHEYPLPGGITAIRRGEPGVEAFVDDLARKWEGAPAPVSTHLVDDRLLARLWARGLRTVPVLHNTREGWRNDPAAWPVECVPMAVACAESVRLQAEASGCRVPVVTLRHEPRAGAAATDPGERRRIREEWNIPAGAFVVGVVGAFKAQKDHARAVEVLAKLRRHRDAVLVIVGGTLDTGGLAELDRVASRAAALGVGPWLRLPGFALPIEPWYAAFDALLNVSRHEGFAMATREALAAGLPVVAAGVGGQGEVAHERLQVLPAASLPEAFASRLAALPVRRELAADPSPRAPRLWSLPTGWRRPGPSRLDTLFVTANLNAGGAQRSLVNLARELAGRHRLAIAVCGETTHPAFPAELAESGVECFRPSQAPDAIAAAEGIIARATGHAARNLCFWNADPRVKLLVAAFAPPEIRIVDASPGAYAYEELESAAALARAIAFGPAQYYRRLDCLVTKFEDRTHPPCRRVERIANGVRLREPARALPGVPRFLVSGRIAPSKRLETVVGAFGEVLADFPGARLEIVGEAESRHQEYLESVLRCAAGLPVAFRGAQPGLEFLDEPFTAAIVLGTHQGCPNAVLEAMAAGVAAIANASGGTGELVRHAETGWLLPEACTRAELAAAIREAAGDPRRARRFGEAARAHVARHHRIEQMALRYLSILELPAHHATSPQEFIHAPRRLQSA